MSEEIEDQAGFFQEFYASHHCKDEENCEFCRLMEVNDESHLVSHKVIILDLSDIDLSLIHI